MNEAPKLTAFATPGTRRGPSVPWGSCSGPAEPDPRKASVGRAVGTTA
jgi:hypothetical protein